MKKTRSLLALAAVAPLMLAAAQSITVERPAGAGTGEVEAHLVASQGKVTLRANGGAFPVGRGLPLIVTDVLEVDLASYAIVELANGYLVRIDEDLAMPISDLALRSAPRASTGFQQQLKALLSATEHRDIGAERIAGYHARVTSAESLAPRPAVDDSQARPAASAASANASRKRSVGGTDAAPAREQERPVVASKPAPASAPKSESRKSPPPARAESAVPAPQPVAELEPAIELDSGAKDLEPRWYLQTLEGGRIAQTGPLPKIASDALANETLRSCLARELAPKFGRAPEKIEIMLQVREGKVRRATLGRGLQAHQCLRPFDKQLVADFTQAVWIVFEVTLP